MKVESHDRYLWPTDAAVKLAVGDWIERVNNRLRRHSAIGMTSPSTSKTNSLTAQPPYHWATKRRQAQNTHC
jgi:hypothetical protein